MNLHELHTPHPLHDADFAAIRARVRAEVGRRAAWLALFARLAFAAGLVVMFVPIARERVPHVPVQVAGPIGPKGLIGLKGPIGRPIRPLRPIRPIRPVRPPKPPELQATRIEILTEDPTIRIIWLTPKENS